MRHAEIEAALSGKPAPISATLATAR